MEELIWAIRKLKRNKAAGPDGVPIDVYKEMNAEQLELVLKLLNQWWNGEEMPPEVTQANVILMFMKGNKADLDNYRPISLLNTNYKLHTSIQQKSCI